MFECFRPRHVTGARVDPLGSVVPCGEIHRESDPICGKLAFILGGCVQVQGVGLACPDQGTGRYLPWHTLLDRAVVRLHVNKVKSLHERLQGTHAPAKSCVAAPWCPGRHHERAVFMACHKGVVEVVVQRTPCQYKCPTLHTIRAIMDAAKTRFIVADHAVQGIILSHCVGRRSIVKVKNGHCLVRVRDLGPLVGNVLGNEFLFRMLLLRLRNDVCNTMLPIQRDTPKIGLIADLQDHIAMTTQVPNDLARQSLLILEQPLVFVQRVHVRPVDLRRTIDVVNGIQWTETPLFVPIEWAKQCHLHHDALRLGLANKTLEPTEIIGIPLGQVEFRTTPRIAVLVTACKGGQKPIPFGRQSVARNIKGPERLHIRTAHKDTRIIEPVFCQCPEICVRVKIGIQYGPVMLCRRDQDGGSALPQKVMGVVRMKGNGLGAPHPGTQ